jgi:type IV pilus assembly protein PilV
MNTSIRTTSKHAGFSLVEVMVALVVISVGLLGIAKMQALALSSTGSARTRSLASLQAASLAATMQADRAYWSAITAANYSVTVSSTGTFSTTSDSNLVAPSNSCVSTSATSHLCTAVQLAAQDLTEWGTSLHSALPSSSATIACNQGGVVTAPPNCAITITWTDHVVGMNTSTNTAATSAQVKTALTNFATQTSTYQLFVEP